MWIWFRNLINSFASLNKTPRSEGIFDLELQVQSLQHSLKACEQTRVDLQAEVERLRYLNQGDNVRALDLEREVHTLQLELHERDRLVTHLQDAAELQQQSEDNRVAETLHTHLERLLTDVATPATQLLTQAYLLENLGRSVAARDVLIVAKRLVRTLESYGLAIGDDLGAVVPFDPDHHQPLSMESLFSLNEQVFVKFAKVSYRGKVIRKAGVARE